MITHTAHIFTNVCQYYSIPLVLNPFLPYIPRIFYIFYIFYIFEVFFTFFHVFFAIFFSLLLTNINVYRQDTKDQGYSISILLISIVFHPRNPQYNFFSDLFSIFLFSSHFSHFGRNESTPPLYPTN